MNKNHDIRICFMGTPEFAVASLKKLIENKQNVVCVVTAPDKPAGRGKKIQESAVKQYAKEVDIPVLQPTNLKSEDFLAELKSYKPNLNIVVAFRMLPESVWQFPELGTFNLHASLLPNYRGAAPINWAVINGEKETGVTTFFIKHEIDTGNIIFQEKIPVLESDDAGNVHDKLMDIGAGLVLKTVDAIANNQINPIPQHKLLDNEHDLKPAPKIFKNTCRINWNIPGETIYNLIRGLSPYPAAWTVITNDLDVINIKIYKATFEKAEHEEMTGSIQTDHKKTLKIAVPDGYIHLQTLQQAGKKRMTADAFLAGFKHIEEYRFS